jgi:ABC-type taurine transport system substrate-binding protein
MPPVVAQPYLANPSLWQVPILNVSMIVRLSGANLVHVRKLADTVQKYMSEPAQLDGPVAAPGSGAEKPPCRRRRSF